MTYNSVSGVHKEFIQKYFQGCLEGVVKDYFKIFLDKFIFLEISAERPDELLKALQSSKGSLILEKVMVVFKICQDILWKNNQSNLLEQLEKSVEKSLKEILG